MSQIIIEYTINGVECKTIDDAVKAIKENKANNSINDLAERYMNGELEFSELKAELEKAGATDVRYERSDSGKCVIRFTLNGVSSAILNNRNEFQQSVNMDTGEVTTVGVNNKADKAPDENQYGSRDLLKLVYNLSDEEINKYFTPTEISDGHFVTYVFNPDIKINGVECKTIEDLKKALNKKKEERLLLNKSRSSFFLPNLHCSRSYNFINQAVFTSFCSRKIVISFTIFFNFFKRLT